MTQDEMKRLVGAAAAAYVNQNMPEGITLGVGTGSTANFFIDAIAKHKNRYRGAVSSSDASTARLLHYGIDVFDLNQIDDLPVYVDGADEINELGHMLKGGGGALTREKILASVAKEFVCVVDASKCVSVLGFFPLPVEVIPMARTSVAHALRTLGGMPKIRVRPDGDIYMSDNGCIILDVHRLKIIDPEAFEVAVNQIPGVVTVGLFAHRGADICLMGSVSGVKKIDYRGEMT
ncbi:ribose-5-phosphate isomerase RpiA [Candidatus Pandoraea novymonadis]|uniref:Ribose-5-phosphate isomerase A n=1 Tax=Candidatus Pandoraea novymonadis TaxID=1808959 RepID=A0ABX5FEZ9_9BURK|nr:ribose-5-phosphate isomerase RpiA [Candidatus Pandoraea novymonadis]PSB92273.1 Ribose-5-phosphate isomerase A [Candidatus Pandoraea novymonadis]